MFASHLTVFVACGSPPWAVLLVGHGNVYFHMDTKGRRISGWYEGPRSARLSPVVICFSPVCSVRLSFLFLLHGLAGAGVVGKVEVAAGGVMEAAVRGVYVG